MEYRNRNYNQLAPQVYMDLKIRGVSAPSRNGPVLRLPGVNTFVVDSPWQRVNFSPTRDANPFFHLIEAMAMLANVNDSKFLAHFAKNMIGFSDDGLRYNAFYGERLLHTWGNQLVAIIQQLRDDKASRQCVAQIWDPSDLHRKTKDKACNLMLLFSVVDGKLEMTSFNRSNDAIWGIVTGANIVHLSFFQEYVACSLGLPMGPWSHVSNNVHVYTENPKWAALKNDQIAYDWYSAMPGEGYVPLMPDGSHAGVFPVVLASLMRALSGAVQRHTTYDTFHAGEEEEKEICAHFPFLFHTVIPVFNAWQCHKEQKDATAALRWVDRIASPDWKAACKEWLKRRYEMGGAK